MKKLKHVFNWMAYIVLVIWKTLRNRRFWGILGLLVMFYLWGWFNANYTARFQTPLVIQERYQKKEVLPVNNKTPDTNSITPTPKKLSEKETIMLQPHGEILWKVYQLESQRGKTDYCRNNNKGWGGFGVLSNGNIVCYESFEKAVERAEYWLSLLNPDKNLVQALCSYNLGPNDPFTGKPKQYSGCSYYQSYLSL